MCWPFFPMMAPTACAGMNTCTISCSGACCETGAVIPLREGHGLGAPPPPCAHPQRGAGRHWAANVGDTLLGSPRAQQGQGRAPPTAAQAETEVPCTEWAPAASSTAQERHPTPAFPLSANSQVSGSRRRLDPRGGHGRAQGLPVPTCRTYHKGAVGSGSGDAAGGGRDRTGRGWKKTYSCQVQAGDEM